jgi:hypothetical protein
MHYAMRRAVRVRRISYLWPRQRRRKRGSVSSSPSALAARSSATASSASAASAFASGPRFVSRGSTSSSSPSPVRRASISPRRSVSSSGSSSCCSRCPVPLHEPRDACALQLRALLPAFSLAVSRWSLPLRAELLELRARVPRATWRVERSAALGVAHPPMPAALRGRPRSTALACRPTTPADEGSPRRASRRRASRYAT